MRSRVPALGLVLAPFFGASAQESSTVPFEGRGLLAVRAGTIHAVEDGSVLENGAILIQAGRILAVGNELDIPADAEIVDYGPGTTRSLRPGTRVCSLPVVVGASGIETVGYSNDAPLHE